MRKKYSKLTQAESEKRNELMYVKYQKLLKKKYGKMKIYQILADEFDLEERNSVASIINKLRKGKQSTTQQKQLTDGVN